MTESDSLWDSGWITHDEPKIYVSQSILGVCNAIQDKFAGLEWAILLKGEWSKYGYIIGNTYAVPKQEVSAASVKFDDADVEKHKVDGFNVILHSHHNMGIGFSHSDDTTLTDSSFESSILYAKGKFTDATVNFTVVEGVRVAIKPKVEVVGFLTELPEWIDTVITKYTYKGNGYNKYRGLDDYKDNEKDIWEKPITRTIIRGNDGTYKDDLGFAVDLADLKGSYRIVPEDKYKKMRDEYDEYGMGYI